MRNVSVAFLMPQSGKALTQSQKYSINYDERYWKR